VSTPTDRSDATGVVVVTGAGSGIGAACAEQAAARGLTVVAVGRRAERLDDLAARTSPGVVVSVPADITTDAGRVAVLTAARDAGQPVVALIHAAGDDLVRAFDETSSEDLAHLLAVNLVAPFTLTQLLLRHLGDAAGVVFVGSISAVRGRARHAAYGASKAALIGLTTNLAVELAPRLRVNLVSPGATRTALLRQYVKSSSEGLTDTEREHLAIADGARLQLGRVAEPAEVATVCIHLALDATAVTGIDVPVDVGYTAS
jgi:NAD(P)-dependent dehydrogenase (short-subunit alcohol dehydrogenase family)